MSDIDPDEIVSFGNRDMTLRSAVELVLHINFDRRLGVTVFRGEGRTPALLGAEEIEQLAVLPEFFGDY